MTERYENLDGLRTISCLCIIAMHIKANADYTFKLLPDIFIASWTHFVLLFIMISGFGMCCGYYEKIKHNQIDLNSFYAKRYKKLCPFFITLIAIDIMFDRSLSHAIEGFAEATLTFGLLPNNDPEVIGVSWTLGVIFLFYMLFPYIVFLCWDKRRAWLTFAVSIVLCVFCSVYFFSDRFVIASFTPRHNFLYCAPFFIGGVLTYLYRHSVKNFITRFRWPFLMICGALTLAWYYIPTKAGNVDISHLWLIAVFTTWLMYAISVESRVLNNRVTKYVSVISMEMYLSHMVMFRMLEKAKVLYLMGHGWLSFITVWLAIIGLLIGFISVWKYVFRKVISTIHKRL